MEIGKINQTAKQGKTSEVIDLYSIYLLPAAKSGTNLCKFASVHCKLGCLAESGRLSVKNAQNAMLMRTALFLNDKELFLGKVINEIKIGAYSSEVNGKKFAVRLNGTSDIDFSQHLIDGKTIFEHLPNIQFYDYTKDVSKLYRNRFNNYHLTLSYSGTNENECKGALKDGYNVAVVFSTTKKKNLPVEFWGFDVIDGDLTDYRPSDKKGCIVGLRYKNLTFKGANEINTKVKESPFVITV